MTATAQLRIGIDLGGTKTEVILLSGADGELFRTRIPTVRGDYAATIEAIAGLVAQAEAAAGVDHLPVGIGIPGTVSRKTRSEEHTSELQSRENLVCRLLLE